MHHIPKKGGKRSISTLSFTTKRLLLCFLGGLPTIGMVSFGPVGRSRLRLARGGVVGPPEDSTTNGCLSSASGGASGLTTTIGGAGDALSTPYRRSLPWEERAAVDARLTEPLAEDKE